MRELSLLVEKNVGIQLLKVPESSCNFTSCQINNDVTIFLDGYIADASCLGDLRGEALLTEFYRVVVHKKQYSIVQKINGHYNIIVIDRRLGSIIVITDRFGLRPLYWSELDRGFVVSTLVKRISELDGFNAEINKQSLFEFIKFGFVLSGATFFKRINRLSCSSINCFHLNGDVSKRQYANWKLPEPINSNSVDENAEIIYSLLDRAVQRTLVNVSSPAVTISGGLDSRIIAGLITRIQGGNSPSFFHCPLTPSETRGAQGVVNALGGELESYPLKKRISRVLSAPIEYGDGCTSLNQFWLFELFKERISSANVDCVFDGFFLDMLLLPPHSFMHYGKRWAEKEMYEGKAKFSMDQIYGLPTGYFDQYFFDSEYPYMDKDALGVACIFLNDLEQVKNDSQYCRNMYLRTRGERYVLPMANVNQNFCNIRFPGLDYDLFDFCMTLPSRQIRNLEVYLQVFRLYFPELSLIEWARTGIPLCNGIKKQAQKKNKVTDFVPFYLLRLSLGRVDFVTPPDDINRSFRRNVSFRQSVLSLFRNQYCIQQGIIGKKGFGRLVKNILNGKNDFFVLERLLTIEMFFKKFVES